MPNIIVSEHENQVLRTFDAGENTVLVPIIYRRDKDGHGFIEADNIPGEIYYNAKKFRDDFEGHVAVVDKDAISIYDRTYYYIYELLRAGLNVVVKRICLEQIGESQDDAKWHTDADDRLLIDEDTMCDFVNRAISQGLLEEFKDKNIFNIKFVTSGAYPNIGPKTAERDSEGNIILGEDAMSGYNGMMNLVSGTSAPFTSPNGRGDCVALLEMREFFANDEDLVDTINVLGIGGDDQYKYAAMSYPWCDFVSVDPDNMTRTITLPASFAYLRAYAQSTRVNANWFAAAGVNRGVIPGLVAPCTIVGENLMHILQGDIPSRKGSLLDIRVNPVYNAGVYGYRLWGNRTVYASPNTTKLEFGEFLNVRILACDIKKQIFHAAMRTTFEPNDDIVWYNFTASVNPLLEKMLNGRGIKYYKWRREDALDRAEIRATLILQPIEAVEKFVINIELTDDETLVTESSSAQVI